MKPEEYFEIEKSKALGIVQKIDAEIKEKGMKIDKSMVYKGTGVAYEFFPSDKLLAEIERFGGFDEISEIYISQGWRDVQKIDFHYGRGFETGLYFIKKPGMH